MCGAAMNRLHISIKEFYEMTPRQFFYAMEDWKFTMELHRDQVYSNIDLEIMQKYVPREILRLPWEDKYEETLKEITEDDWSRWDNA